MALIEEIQAAAISEAGDISALLRKCKLLAARLDAKEFGEWVACELNGYPMDAILPPYRVVYARSYGDFVGPFGMRGNGLQIPVAVLPEHLQQKWREIRMGEAISAYQSLLDGDGTGSARIPWPVGLAVEYASKLTPDMQCVSAWVEIPLPAIHKLINAVKSAVLGFAIDIERESPDAGESPIGAPRPISEEKVTQIFNTNITGSVGNVANGGTDFAQTGTVNVQAGDWEALQRCLTALGIGSEATATLRAELDTLQGEGAVEGKSKGRQILGRLVSKAATSGTSVAVEIAATGIAKAIAGYLGFNVG
ncbi:AbiTii domain-containing protein [Burkholderia glumae]|uniref:AbiTii domain-containing protein n=1 Tax=Burkholderia glumae TaxID=337 RepID=A0ABY5BBU2_BURGL|nr:hypothetical protein [Burkholderia glumae]USS44119.1 hypothetical protein NFI99_12570 [Burkholderia glumae]UVT05837.1 hypothetical protein EFP20_30220 [Burkholderia glumae]